VILPGKRSPWNWIVKTEHPLTGEIVESKVEVYQETDDAQVQMVCHMEDVTFDGPSLIPVELEDIVVPSRCENLQPRTQANPTGANHVFMVQYPTRDELLRLIKSGFYDEVTPEQITEIKGSQGALPVGSTVDPQGQKILQDDLAGVKADDVEPDEPTFTRLVYFGKADLDGDGYEEEVVYWFLKELKIFLRARYLTEVYPTSPMRRPFSMAKYIPVNGQFYAIGLIELMESCYDIIKKTFDQMIDNGDLTNTPWGFYRPMSGIRPEVMRMGPGDHYPTNNPKDDVFYPTLPQGMATFGQNVIGLVSQILDQATLVGQLQLGGVPSGKSAALRTTSNMQSLLQQGDARPERVLRRFFCGLVEVWQQFHELNQIFLPKGKAFRIAKSTDNTDPFVTLADKSQITGRFIFSFGASILNTNRALATAALQDMISVQVNPLLIQLGITTPQNLYNLIRDWIKARGQDPTEYVTSPTNDPFATQTKISAEDAILAIMNGYFPHGQPMEPIEEHLEKLKEFAIDKEKMAVLSTDQTRLFGQYAATVVQKLQQMQQQQMMMANAAAMQKQVSAGQPGATGGAPVTTGTPPSMGPAGNPMTQGGASPVPGGGVA